MFSPIGPGPAQPRDQEFFPLLFSLTPADNLTTPRSVTPHRTAESMSAQRGRSMNTSGSVHTEATPQAPPPPVSRLEDVTMEDASTSGRQPPLVLSPGFPASQQGAAQALMPQSTALTYDDVWVTVFGFTQADVPLILKEFAECGDILQWGTFGVPQANFIHIQYQNKYAAQRALRRDGEQLTSSLIIGVKPVEDRHRAAIAEYNSGSQTLQIQRPAMATERPYKLQWQPNATQIPLPSRSLASKVAEFVFGI